MVYWALGEKYYTGSFFLTERNDYCSGTNAADTMHVASKELKGSWGGTEERAMVTVKSSQKIFTDSEVASLTGICVEHVHNFAKGRHLRFIARAADAAASTAVHWQFDLS